VAWAAFFNFVAAFGFGVAVATTVGRGIVKPEVVDHGVICAGVGAAFVWDWITWRWGLPSSSSHALRARLGGAGAAKGGFGVLVPAGLFKVAVFIVVSPIVGFVLGALFMVLALHAVHRATPATVDRVFRRLQLLSAAGYSLGHGTNDAQKTMGIIAVLLFSAGMLGDTFYVPFWVVLICHAAIALGTMFGGWRIVRTMGMRMPPLQPIGGFCAETSGAIALLGSAAFGIPVSTTHTITGAIVGVGSTRRLSAVRWGAAREVVWAWILTIPCTAAISAAIYLPLRML